MGAALLKNPVENPILHPQTRLFRNALRIAANPTVALEGGNQRVNPKQKGAIIAAIGLRKLEARPLPELPIDPECEDYQQGAKSVI